MEELYQMPKEQNTRKNVTAFQLTLSMNLSDVVISIQYSFSTSLCQQSNLFVLLYAVHCTLVEGDSRGLPLKLDRVLQTFESKKLETFSFVGSWNSKYFSSISILQN